MIISIEDLRDPFESEITLIGEEDAAHCDGGACGELFYLDGHPIEPRPHHHIVVAGSKPAATQRRFAVF